MRNNGPKSLVVVFSEIKSRLDKQFEQIESLNQRASVIMGFVTLLISLLTGFAVTADVKFLPKNPALLIILMMIAMVLYLHIIIFAFLGYRAQTYRRDPEPRPLRDGYLFKEMQETKRTVASNFIESYEFNKKTIDRKVWMINVALILFIIEMIYIVILAFTYYVYRAYTI